MAPDRTLLQVTSPQFDAIIAGLRLLQSSLDRGDVAPDDGDVGDILTCNGDHAGLTAAEIDDLAISLIAG